MAPLGSLCICSALFNFIIKLNAYTPIVSGGGKTGGTKETRGCSGFLPYSLKGIHGRDRRPGIKRNRGRSGALPTLSLLRRTAYTGDRHRAPTLFLCRGWQRPPEAGRGWQRPAEAARGRPSRSVYPIFPCKDVIIKLIKTCHTG